MSTEAQATQWRVEAVRGGSRFGQGPMPERAARRLARELAGKGWRALALGSGEKTPQDFFETGLDGETGI